HEGAIAALANSTEGHHLLSVDQSGGVRLWDVDKGEGTQLLFDTGNSRIVFSPVNCVAFSPDERTVAVGTGCWYAACDTDTGKTLTDFLGSRGSLVYSSDGGLLASASVPPIGTGNVSMLQVWRLTDRPTNGMDPRFHWTSILRGSLPCMVGVPGDQYLLCEF